jgi:hypothetical protein
MNIEKGLAMGPVFDETLGEKRLKEKKRAQ